MQLLFKSNPYPMQNNEKTSFKTKPFLVFYSKIFKSKIDILIMTL